jgi:hypothetical protein
MFVISMVGAAFCNKAAVIIGLSVYSGYRTVDLKEILARAAKTSVFNHFTLEKERSDSQPNRRDRQNRRGSLSDEHLPQV